MEKERRIIIKHTRRHWHERDTLSEMEAIYQQRLQHFEGSPR